jgi:colanic acid biosynthesis glycosyl transferase WcaI
MTHALQVKPVRILLLTQWFDPEPTFKGMAFARELKKHCFDVEVITGFPNYPGGKVYPGYRIKWMKREVIDGIQVTRLPLYPSHNRSGIMRAANYITFAISAALYGVFFARSANVIYAYHPPLTVGIAAVLIKFFRRISVVCDIQDLWPDTLSATGMVKSTRVLSLVARICSWVYEHTDQIVVLSPGFKRLLVCRGVPESKLTVIYNWSNELSIQDTSDSLPFNLSATAGFFKILFAGNIGKAQGLDVVLEAASLLKGKHSNILWIMLGEGLEVERLKAEAVKQSLSNIVFIPRVSMTDAAHWMRSADVLLVHLKRDPLFEITIPSKIQAYMNVGKPQLAALDGDAADLVRRASAGIVVQPENPEELADAALYLSCMPRTDLEQMGYNAKNYYQQNLSIAVGVGKFSEIFRLLSA